MISKLRPLPAWVVDASKGKPRPRPRKAFTYALALAAGVALGYGLASLEPQESSKCQTTQMPPTTKP